MPYEAHNAVQLSNQAVIPRFLSLRAHIEEWPLGCIYRGGGCKQVRPRNTHPRRILFLPPNPRAHRVSLAGQKGNGMLSR